MIGKDQKLTIHWRWESYNKASIKLETDNIDDPESIWYLLIEWLWHFLDDLRKVLPSDQKKLYNEYVQSLLEETKKVLIAVYKDV